MKIRLLTIGKIKEKYLQDGIAEYLKRLKPYATVEIIEVMDEAVSEKASPSEIEILNRRKAKSFSNI